MRQVAGCTWRPYARRRACNQHQHVCTTHYGPRLRDGLVTLPRSLDNAGGGRTANPLEQLRNTTDPVLRSQLLLQLDDTWSRHCDEYRPSPVEQYVVSELGLWQYNVMMAAVQNPALVQFSVDEQVKPTISSLKAIQLSAQDIWFLISKKPSIMETPMNVQRWLDFLSAENVAAPDMLTFVSRAPDTFFKDCTLHQANTVIAYLQSLKLKKEMLARRVYCIWPGILMQDVQAQLQPIVLFLMNIGLEVSEIARLTYMWPELLLSDVGSQLQPFVAYLRSLGCEALQVCQVILECPHLLHQDPATMFSSRLACLKSIGITDDGVKSMIRRSTAFLTVRGGFQEQLQFLKSCGYTDNEIRNVIVNAPAVLAEKPLELERKWAFLSNVIGGSKDDVLQAPSFLAANLMQIIGPRHSFVSERGLLARVALSPVLDATSRSDKCCQVDLGALVSGDDAEFTERVGASANEFTGYRVQWEESYTERLHQDAAREFQDELKKLGIYEGA